MDRLQWILSRVDGRCVRTACQDQAGKCSLSMERLEVADYLLLAMNGPGVPAFQSRTRCDFLFFGRIPEQEHFWACPVELTVGLRNNRGSLLRQALLQPHLNRLLRPVLHGHASTVCSEARPNQPTISSPHSFTTKR